MTPAPCARLVILDGATQLRVARLLEWCRHQHATAADEAWYTELIEALYAAPPLPVVVPIPHTPEAP